MHEIYAIQQKVVLVTITTTTKNIIVPICTIVYPCMDVFAITEVKQIPKSVYNINQAHKDFNSHTICINDSDHDYIIDKIKRREDIEYARDMSVDNNEKYLI